MSRKAEKKRALPEGWREVKLGNVCSVDEQTLSSKTPDDYCFMYVSLSDIEKGKLLQTKKYKFSDAPSRARRIVKQGDVLLATVRPNLQGFYIFKDKVKDFVVSTGFAVLTPKSHILDSMYLFQLLFSRKMLQTYDIVNVGSNYPAINSSDIPNFKILVPSFPEQKAIASLLETWDTAIEKTEALIEAKEKRFKWLLKTLISDQQGNPEWRKVKLGQAFTLGRGRVISKKEINNNLGSFPVYSSQTSCRGEFGKISTYDFEGDHITWTTDGANAGAVFYRTGKFNCTNVCGIAKPIDPKEIDCQFISYFLQGKTKRYVSYVGNPKLMNNIFANIPILFPYLPEQKAIASLLNIAQHEIDLLKKFAERYQISKRGLMQKLLTGEWKVKIKEN